MVLKGLLLSCGAEALPSIVDGVIDEDNSLLGECMKLIALSLSLHSPVINLSKWPQRYNQSLSYEGILL